MVMKTENLVFQGGGAKGVIYAGSIRALDELGILPYVKRAAAASAGCAPALFTCLGLDASQIEEETNKLNMKEFFDGYEGPIPFFGQYFLARNAFKHLGMHPCKKGLDYFGDILEKYSGDRDLTFKQLYNKFGRELCIAVSNVSRHQAEYCHVNTTPDMPIRKAIRASMSLPILWEPVELNDVAGEKYVDGGLFTNFPLKAFDGWFLSTKPGDDILAKIAKHNPELYEGRNMLDSKQILSAYQEVMVTSFQEPNMATIGFRLVADESADNAAYAGWSEMVERKMRLNNSIAQDNERKDQEPDNDIPYPNTKLANAYRKKMDDAGQAISDNSKYEFAYADLLAWLVSHTDSLSKTKVDDHPHAIRNDVLLQLLNEESPRNCNPELFGLASWGEFVNKMDGDRKGYVTRGDVSKFWEKYEVRNAFLKNRKPIIISSLGDLAGQTFNSIFTVNEETLLRDPHNAARVCNLSAKYVHTLSLELEQEDRDFLYALGKKETLAWIKKHK